MDDLQDSAINKKKGGSLFRDLFGIGHYKYKTGDFVTKKQIIKKKEAVMASALSISNFKRQLEQALPPILQS